MVWHGMVWCGGAEQIPAFACFNINVSTKQNIKTKGKGGNYDIIISRGKKRFGNGKTGA